MPFVEGLALGLAMIVFIGPVVFTLLHASLKNGFIAGFSVAVGIIISDIAAIGICLAGAIPFFNNTANQFWIAIAGAVLLLMLGIKYITSPVLFNEKDVQLKKKEIASYFTKGFLVNFINPFVFMVWIGILLVAREKYTSGNSYWIFIGAILIGIFLQDALKAYFAPKIKPLLNPRRLKIVYKWIGYILVLFSIRLMVWGFQL